MEVNASDERTGEKILGKIKNALNMNSISGKNPFECAEPVCLIVDEVDGAIGNGSYTDCTKGVSMIADYLKKCINYTAQKTKKKADNDEEDDEILPDD